MRAVRAITFDLDDTLWEIGPVIERAERKVYEEIRNRFPRVAGRYDVDGIKRTRQQVLEKHPEVAHDLTEIRRVTFNLMLAECGYDPDDSHVLLETFLQLRHEVEFFSDVMPALRRLSERYPLLTMTNGNADVERLGITHFLRGTSAPVLPGSSSRTPAFSNLPAKCWEKIRALCYTLAITRWTTCWVRSMRVSRRPGSIATMTSGTMNTSRMRKSKI